MTTALNFATFPPEINSARMHSGPGAAPMLAAASAWSGLAAELRATALSYGSILSSLSSEEWHGPASASMAASAAPYVAWMSSTAAAAEQTAAQAMAAAGAYESAFAATVPPAVIAANRAQLMTLIATNICGQNTAAIAANEAQYADMWAQDAMAMFGYAGASASTTRLRRFCEPRQMTNLAGVAAQSTAVAQSRGGSAASGHTSLSQLLSAVPTTLEQLASGSSWLDKLWAEWGPNANIWNTVASSGLYLPSNTIAPFLGMLAADAAEDATAAGALGAASGALTSPLGSTLGLGGAGSAVAAGLGKAAAVGTLSVPPTWTATAPSASPLAASLGGTPMVAPPGAAGMPGMPLGAFGKQSFGRAVPQYGFRPRFVAHPPAAG
ncbi:PPE family protein [Mycobacterium spongiae]|uniref:PPE domain-containing protein n=1 Tax=Mycobacterium spongiae TaxID=886343 RepID=A0A975JXM3_9MYCO|nr:PPE family protein [Mycobacterium spongiae]QUR67569.1 PPE domain-containing protein [Mycobacterium spongiae]